MGKRRFGRIAVWTIVFSMLLGMTAAMAALNTAYAAEEAGTVWAGLSDTEYVPGEVIVKFKEQRSARGLMSGLSFESTAEQAGIELNQTQQLANGAAVYETGGEVLETVAALQDDPRVEYVQPNFIYRLTGFPDDAPDDADWAAQWGMHTDTYGVNALEAWTYTTGNPDIIVAVIDSGVNYDHPDLQGQLTELNGTNFVPNANYNVNQPMDTDNHGSHVSGIIAAAANNGIGIAGIAPSVRILPIKAKEDGNAYMDGVAIYEGIALAAARGAKVVNMSFGGGFLDRLMYELIRDHPDITFVAAAGNDGMDNGEFSVFPANFTVYNEQGGISYPALPNIVSVAALNSVGNLAGFSNYGKPEIYMTAPGDGIRSTCASTPYCNMNGTSMAAPFVSGAAALLYALDDSLTPAEVIGLLIDRATPLASLTDKTKFGSTLNSAASVAYLANRASAATASPESGAVSRGTPVALSTDTENADIYYTVDGSEPTEVNGFRYEGPIAVETPVTIRARAYANGKFHSKTSSFAYTLRSDSASLSALSVSAGALSPAFAPEETEYTVDVANDVNAIEVTAEASDPNAALQLNGGASVTGSVYGSIALEVGNNPIKVKVTAEDGIAAATYNITVNRAEADGGETVTPPPTPTTPSTPSTPSAPSTPPSKTTSEPAPSVGPGGTITAPPKLDSQTGTAAAEIDAATMSEAIGQAESGSGGKIIEIEIPAIDGARTYETTLAASSLAALPADTRLRLRTPAGTLTLPGNALNLRTSDGASKVAWSISLEERSGGRPEIRLQLKVNSLPYAWSNEDAPMTISIPYSPTAEERADPERLVIRYIDKDGQEIAVPSGRYDSSTGTVTFSVTHFGDYAVAYVHRSFEDLEGVNWARKPIEVLASKGIVNGTSAQSYSPHAQVRRADFLVMLVKALGLSASVEGGADGQFDDVPQGAYYEQAIGIAKKLGIVTGTGSNLFSPGQPISRQDMFVMTAKALAIAGGEGSAEESSELSAFSNANDIAGYARPSLALLIREGYVAGDKGKLNPRSSTTRAEAAVMLYRIYSTYRLHE